MAIDMITLTSIPPEVSKFFDRQLLQRANPLKFKDDLELIWQIWIYIEKCLWKKLKNLPERKKKCEELAQYFKDVYVRTAAKEKEQKAKKEAKTEEPFYRIAMPDKSSENLFYGLRVARHKAREHFRENCEISEERKDQR